MSDVDATNPDAAADDDLSFDTTTGVDDEAGVTADLSDDEAGDGEDDDSEEVEHEGQKYRLPKALKPALLMQADYTRKTQELAEQRRAFEAQASAHKTVSEDVLKGKAQLYALDERLGAYAKVDWQALAARDRENGTDDANHHWREYQLLKEQREGVSQNVSEKERAQALEAQQIAAKRQQEGLEVLQRDIPGWSPKLVGEMREFGAKTFGFTPQELGEIEDPRLVKLLHVAMQASKAKTTAAKTTQVETARSVRPVPKVGGTARATNGLSDSLTDEEWARRRNEQVRKRNRG